MSTLCKKRYRIPSIKREVERERERERVIKCKNRNEWKFKRKKVERYTTYLVFKTLVVDKILTEIDISSFVRKHRIIL